MRKTTRRWLYVLGTLAVLGIAAPFLVRYMAARLLEGEEFRKFINHLVGSTLQAEVTTGRFFFHGSQLTTDGLKAHGTPGAWFSQLEASGVKAELSWKRLIFGPHGLDGLSIATADLQLDGPRKVGAVAPAPVTNQAKVELGPVKVDRATLSWKGGSLSKVKLEIHEEDGVWLYQGKGGRLDQQQIPSLEARSFELRQRPQRLMIENGLLELGETGKIKVDGEVNWEKQPRLELVLNLAGIPLEKVPVPPGWENKLTGLVSGDVKAVGYIRETGTPEFSGTLQLNDGRITPAVFSKSLSFLTMVPTLTQQPEKIALSRAECRFRYKEGRLEVTELIMESAGVLKLAKLEGAFVVEKGIIKGDFQVGVPPLLHRLAPKVFSAPVAGYAWAPMHIEGPVEDPKNDLNARAVEALRDASGALLAPLEGLPNPLEVTKGAVDLLQGKKPMTDPLQTGADLLRGVLGGERK